MQSKDRTFQVIAIIGLIIGVAALSVGFAAFTKSLTISSSAEVTLPDHILNVVFSNSSSTVSNGSGVTITGSTNDSTVTPGTANIGSNAVTGIHAAFTGEGSATYTFYVHNQSAFTAYLNNIAFAAVANNTNSVSHIKCEAKSTNGATVGLADACGDITVNVSVSNGTNTFNTYSSASGSSISPQPSITTEAYDTVVVTIAYSAEHDVDGDFDVTIGDITLGYTSVNPSS